jgi:hypothetical protein
VGIACLLVLSLLFHTCSLKLFQVAASAELKLNI